MRHGLPWVRGLPDRGDGARGARAVPRALRRLGEITGAWEARDVAELAELLDRFATDNMTADPDRRGNAQREA